MALFSSKVIPENNFYSNTTIQLLYQRLSETEIYSVVDQEIAVEYYSMVSENKTCFSTMYYRLW